MVLCWNRPSVSSFGYAKSVALKKKSCQENCDHLNYFLANVSLKHGIIFVMGLIEIWPLWRSIASSKPRLYPTFPWFSDLTSCWGVLALASGSVEITSCSESMWMWLFAEVPFSMDKGWGIEHENCLLVLQVSETSEVAQSPLRCQKGLVLDTRKTQLLDLSLLLSGLCLLRWLAGVSGFVLSCSTETFSSWSHSAAFLEGRLSSLPSPSVQQQRSSLFASISNFEWKYSAGYLCSK